MTNSNWLAKKAMLASLNISQWSARRLDRKITDEVNQEHGAVADAGRYNKLLVKQAAIAPIQKIVNEARILHLQMTQPWGDTGSRLLPAALYIKYTDALAKLKGDFERAVERFAIDYPQHVAERRVELNGLFKEDDYPKPEKVRGLFYFGTVILPCPDASDFRVELAAEHAADIREQIEARMKEALAAAMNEPVNRIIEAVGRMAERLKAYKPGTDGEKSTGIFRDSLVTNIRELADLLPAFNLTNDVGLLRITDRIRGELCIEDADALRENEGARQAVAASAEAILAEAQALIA